MHKPTLHFSASIPQHDDDCVFKSSVYLTLRVEKRAFYSVEKEWPHPHLTDYRGTDRHNVQAWMGENNQEQPDDPRKRQLPWVGN
jgi:hypothetical protein